MKANPGDVILINEDGYPTKVMTAKIELLKKEVAKITGKKNRAEELFIRSNAAKRAARTRKKNAVES